MTDFRVDSLDGDAAPGSGWRRVRRSERGVALVIALLAMLLMTALGMALMLVSETESLIGANYRDSVEGQLRRRRRHRARDAGRAQRSPTGTRS